MARLFLLGLVVALCAAPFRRPAVWLITAWLFLAPFWSVQPSHSVASTFPLYAYVLLFLLFREAHVHEGSLRPGLRLLIGSTFILSGYGVYQLLYGYDAYFLGLEQMSETLLPASSDVMHGWLTSLSGRVFSRFALPSQFAIYLLMLLPLHGVLALHESSRILRLLWSAGLLLNGAMFVYTKSFGAWFVLLALCAAGGLFWLMQHRSIPWPRLIAGSLALGACALGITYGIGILRGQHLWDLQGNNPLWFRWLNWKTALAMWNDHLFLGSGLNTFGLLYPQYMLPGANQTQYAHNSYLQIGAEYGLIGILAALWLIGAWGCYVWKRCSEKAAHTSGSEKTGALYRHIQMACAVGGLAFLLHNLIDFDLYVFPLGLLGMALLAFSVRRDEHAHAQEERRLPQWGIAVLVGGALMFGIADWQQAAAARYGMLARQHIKAQQYEDAQDDLEQARGFWAGRSSYEGLRGTIALYQQAPDQAQQHFAAALQTQPYTAWLHAGLSEAYRAGGNAVMAYVESRRAAQLFPQKSEYAQRAEQIRNTLPAALR